MQARYEQKKQSQQIFRARNEEEVRKYEEAVKKKGGEVSV